MSKGEPKKNWSITSDAFRRLLDWLDEGKNSEGRNYLAMRQRLVVFFDRKNCAVPDELADETFNRVARRLEENGTIETETPAKYCYITARFVFLEYLRGADKVTLSLDNERQSPAINSAAVDDKLEEKVLREKMLECLEKCTLKLELPNREIIIGYYYGAERVKIENRRQIAQKLGISSNALSVRACRIRDKLEICVKRCAAEN